MMIKLSPKGTIMDMINVLWSKRPARLVEKGSEQSVIEWIDTGTEQAISNNQFTIAKSDQSYAELVKKHRITEPKRKTSEGPTKQERVNELVAANPTLSRQETIKLIVSQIGMTPAGASTYYYNATKKG